MNFLTVWLFTLYLALPGILLWRVGACEKKSLAAWIASAFVAGAYITWIWLMGVGWTKIGVFWPYLFLAILAVLVARRITRRHPGTRWPRRGSLEYFAAAAKLFAATYLAVSSLQGWLAAREPGETPVDLAFPLTGGTFYVVHGGGGESLNYHRAVKGQSYALDIVKLNALGTAPNTIFPDALEDFETFGTPIVAPCSGEVTAAETSHPDQALGHMDETNVLGNFVAISCRGVTVVLAHFQAGSVMVGPGDRVVENQAIGRVGNSGRSTGPHLHIHAVRGIVSDRVQLTQSAEPVAISFAGRFLIRNDRVRN